MCPHIELVRVVLQLDRLLRAAISQTTLRKIDLPTSRHQAKLDLPRQLEGSAKVLELCLTEVGITALVGRILETDFNLPTQVSRRQETDKDPISRTDSPLTPLTTQQPSTELEAARKEVRVPVSLAQATDCTVHLDACACLGPIWKMAHLKPTQQEEALTA